MSNILHKGDVGTSFTYYCRDGEDIVDISSATVTKNLKFVRPNGTKITRAAYFGDGDGGVDAGSGTAGILAYDFVDGDLSQDGEWGVQGQITFDATTKPRSFTEKRFHVHEKL